MVFRDILSGFALGLPLVQGAIPSIPGFSLVWAEDFTGNAGSLHQQHQQSAPQRNGRLQIIAIRERHGCWTSARIESQRADFVCRKSGKMRIEASLSVPATLGAAYRGQYWNWPGIGEFDIMENANGINRVWGVLHCGPRVPGAACQGNLHTYTFEVDRTQQQLKAIRLFVDGILFHQIAVHNPHFILLSLAIGGAFPNKNYSNTTPLPTTTSGGVFEAQYIAVYNN
ncbi:glycoside hydrolase family 16 protein [Parathielavia appendiculata]|uniref:Glycoside hydrolase family 16 protein n=1 Tax=Parathielavia appendiculata TaxID=2587402 RepID=A0AAN6U3N8_9PEZI|nr:glycoside hydrolase family 16 protein [Parathielavia appendiculata]